MFDIYAVISAGFRTNEVLCYVSYEAPYLGPEGGRPGRPTQVVNSIIIHGIAPKQNAFKFKFAPHKQNSIVTKFCSQEDGPLPPLGQRGLVLKHTQAQW